MTEDNKTVSGEQACPHCNCGKIKVEINISNELDQIAKKVKTAVNEAVDKFASSQKNLIGTDQDHPLSDTPGHIGEPGITVDVLANNQKQKEMEQFAAVKKVKPKLIKSVKKMAAFGETTKQESVEREVTTPTNEKASKEVIKARLDNDLNDPTFLAKATDGKTKELSDTEKENIKALRDELSGLFSTGVKRDHLSELDAYIEGCETDEDGAVRNPDSGKGVRIRFKGKKKQD